MLRRRQDEQTRARIQKKAQVTRIRIQIQTQNQIQISRPRDLVSGMGKSPPPSYKKSYLLPYLVKFEVIYKRKKRMYTVQFIFVFKSNVLKEKPRSMEYNGDGTPFEKS